MSTFYWQVGVMAGVAVAIIKLCEWALSHSPSPPVSGHAKRCLARINEFDPFSE